MFSGPNADPTWPQPGPGPSLGQPFDRRWFFAHTYTLPVKWVHRSLVRATRP